MKSSPPLDTSGAAHEARPYEPAEARASVARLARLVNDYLEASDTGAPALRMAARALDPATRGIEVVTDTPGECVVHVDLNASGPLPAEPVMADRVVVAEATAAGGRRALLRWLLLEWVPRHACAMRHEDPAWERLLDQIWLDGKLEFAVRDVPWMQETEIRIPDLYDPAVRFLIGLGDVRGSASYWSFHANAFANPALDELQAAFREAGIRMLPIPIQMETEQDAAEMPRLLQAILRDLRVERIALTKPMKAVAEATGLFAKKDPDTLSTGAVNSAAIETHPDGTRYFVGRSTDGEGTVAKVRDALQRVRGKRLAEATVGLIGLGGFGRALLGKFLTTPDAPREIRIVVREQSYPRGLSVVEHVREAYRAAYGKMPEARIQVFTIPEADAARRHHPLACVDVLVDASSAGMNDDKMSLGNLDFIRKGMIVLHAAYRTASGENRIPPILVEAYQRGAVVYNGLADWAGHQWLQVQETLKRLRGSTPSSADWNDPKWDAFGNHVRAVVMKWAREDRGYRDAMELLENGNAPRGERTSSPE